MITDRYLQIAALAVAILWFREDLMFGVVILIIPLFFLFVPLAIALFLWQGVYQSFGPKKLRALAKLRWELSMGSGLFKERRRAKTCNTILKVYEISPTVALPEQQERLQNMLSDIDKIDQYVPPLLQRSLTATSLGKALAEASGLAGQQRQAFITALVRAAPKERHVGLVRKGTRALRRILSPLVANKVQRRRIAYVYNMSFVSKQIRSDQRLAVLLEALRTAREVNTLSPLDGELSDVIGDLPLKTQRNLVLLSELAFGILKFERLMFTDPSQVKRLRRLKDKFDDFSPPNQSLWDPETAKTQASRGPEKQTTTPENTPAKAKSPKPELTKEEHIAELEQETLDAIYLKRAWPIGTEVDGRSWLGGAPLLPNSVAWPRTPGTRTPLHFVAQIDCADLPRVSDGEAMPEDGLLLFFVSINEEMTWEDEAGSTNVLYIPASVVPDVTAPLPQGLPDLGHESGQMSGGSARPGIRSYPKWPITAHPIKSYFWDFGMPMPQHDLARELQEKAMQSSLPKPTNKLRGSVMERGFLKANNTEGSEARAQYSISPKLVEIGFPFCGAVMTRFALELEGSLLSQLFNEKRWKDHCIREGKTEFLKKAEDKLARLAEQLTVLEQASERMNAVASLDLPDATARKWFSNWLEEAQTNHGVMVETALRNALMSVAQQSVTDARMRAALPQELFTFFDQALRPTSSQSEHMMLGHPQFKTNSTRSSGVRLLALDSDYGVNFMFCDVGMVEFWINQDDLEKRDFTQVRALTAGG